MKKSTKIIISIAAAMVVLGAGLSGLAWALSGGNVGMSWFPGRSITYGDAPKGISKELMSDTVTTGTFTSVDLNTDYGLVTFVAGENYRVEYQLLKDLQAPSITVENGVLTIRNNPSLPNGTRLFNLSGNWLRQMGRADDDARITVYYPRDAELGDVTICNDIGEIQLAELKLQGKLDLEADLGDISLEGVSAKDTEVRAAMGSVELYQLHTGKLTTDVDMGDVDGEGVQADFLESSVAMGDLDLRDTELAGMDVDADMGSISLSGKLFGDIQAACSMGSVELSTVLPRSEFYIQADTDMGSVEVDGKKMTDSGSSSAPNRITANCDMGSVELYFGVSEKPSKR